MNKLYYILLIAVLTACTAKQQEQTVQHTEPLTNQPEVAIPHKGLPAYVRQHSLVPAQSVVACNTFDEAK
jgi:hypothetical protein